MKLSVDEKTKIRKGRQQIIQALRDRSENNPADFDTNIDCLRKMGKINQSILEVLHPYITKADNDEITPIEMSQLMNEAYTIIKDDSYHQANKEEFAKEPRITALNVNEHHQSTTSTSFFGVREVHGIDYKITFSDGTDITLHSLDDEEDLEEARDEFVEKMEELSQENRPAISACKR